MNSFIHIASSFLELLSEKGITILKRMDFFFFADCFSYVTYFLTYCLVKELHRTFGRCISNTTSTYVKETVYIYFDKRLFWFSQWAKTFVLHKDAAIPLADQRRCFNVWLMMCSIRIMFWKPYFWCLTLFQEGSKGWFLLVPFSLASEYFYSEQ